LLLQDHRTELTQMVYLSVCPVHCGKMADRIWMQSGMLGHVGPGMRQVVEFEDWSMGEGNFGVNVGAPL